MNIKNARHEIKAAHKWAEDGNIPKALLHLEFALDYLQDSNEAVEQSVQRTAEPLCQVCLMPLSQHVHECVVPSTRRR